MDFRVWASLGLALLLPGVARAQDKPVFLPSKAVAVVYRVAGGDMGQGAQKVQMTYAAGGQRMRMDYFRWVEAKYPFAALIVDRAADKVLAINGEARSYIERSAAGLKTPDMWFSGPQMHYTRGGIATIAGKSCSDWTIKSEEKNDPSGTVCITADGIILRILRAGASTPAMIALAVVYGTPPDDIFSAPADFTRRDVPSN